jgi:hypothetical protein
MIAANWDRADPTSKWMAPQILAAINPEIVTWLLIS